jgi:nucleoside recognition membrane protein YjiH
MVVFIGILMAMIFILAVGYLSNLQKFLYKKWDINTATPADFTIKMEITD